MKLTTLVSGSVPHKKSCTASKMMPLFQNLEEVSSRPSCTLALVQAIAYSIGLCIVVYVAKDTLHCLKGQSQSLTGWAF